MTEPTKVGLTEISSLCSTGKKPQILTGILLQLAREQFSNPDNIENQEMKNYIWTKDVESTQILITTVSKWNAQDTQRTPAIMVKRNTTKTKRTLINDGNFAVTRDSIKHGDFYTKEISGSHTLFCIGAEELEAELVATELFDHLMQFGPAIKKDMGLHFFEIGQMPGASKLEESHEHWVVPIVAAWVYYAGWRLKPITPLLKTLGLNFQPKGG